MAQNGNIGQRSRVALIVLWIVQVLLAAMFLMAGGSKLAGAPAMVALFGLATSAEALVLACSADEVALV